jgi:hypothetical protein
MAKEGSWLASDGTYQDVIKTLCTADPRLRNRDPKAVTQRTPWQDRGVRAVHLALRPGSNTFEKPAAFSTPASLDGHLIKSVSKAGDRNVYILEGLGPGFVAVLGSRFGVHPSFFLEHERVIVMNRKSQGESDGIALPSMLETRQHLCLKYFEMLQFDRQPTSFRLVCSDTGRHIGVSRAESDFLDVGIVRRKCSMWTRRTEGGGWDCELNDTLLPQYVNRRLTTERSRHMRSACQKGAHRNRVQGRIRREDLAISRRLR